MNQSLKLTFNNNKKEDDPGLVLSFVKNITFSRDFYFSITPEKCEEIDPATHGTSYSLYVEDNTGWNALAQITIHTSKVITELHFRYRC